MPSSDHEMADEEVLGNEFEGEDALMEDDQEAAIAEPAPQKPARELSGFAALLKASKGAGSRGGSKESEKEADSAGPDAAVAEEASGSNSKLNDIKTSSFDELNLPPNITAAAQDAWRQFISTAESPEAAGEAIYMALFDSAPSIQSLFTTPRAVQAMRFMAGLNSFVTELSDPPKLKILVETLGFGHLHLDVTIPRVVIFRDAILDLFQVELAERFTSYALEGWKSLLNYVGGAIIFVKSHYAERIACLLKSWKLCNHKEEKNAANAAMEDSGEIKMETAEVKKTRGGGWFGKKKDADVGATKGGNQSSSAEVAETTVTKQIGAQQVPTTYPEMFLFNAAVMGFGKSEWMTEVLECFDNIVTNVSNSARLQQECDVLALRISNKATGPVAFADYKSCMLASLRSLLPKDWDTAHEVAWTWLWENVERLLKKNEGKPPIWQRALVKFLDSLDEDQKYEARAQIYQRFFTATPRGQDFFKQSNTYLHIIADKIIDMTVDLYKEPTKMVDDISALGLRHVGYAIPTEFFGPFVSACVEVVISIVDDDKVVQGFRFSLGLVANMLVRTITEGSTIVMKAINGNSQKALRKAISCAPRGERATWMLTVTVGTQTISPLAWAIESGSLEAGVGILRDLLTIRADRDKYYYGLDELFYRHPDLIRTLTLEAPVLLPKLLDGLIWRSRLSDGGLRRVNYYVKHLLMDEDNAFAKSLEWVANMKDPKIVCHPVIAIVMDTLWNHVTYRSFLFGKTWFLFTLTLFLTSQSILKHLNDGDGTDIERIFVFGFRAFIYGCSMTQLIYSHSRDSFKAFRAGTIFKFSIFWLPDYLKKWQESASLFLVLSLLIMLILEPTIGCLKESQGVLFNEQCDKEKGKQYPYALASSSAMFFYYALLIDFAAISTRISAFSLVCIRMLGEVSLFIGALGSIVMAFASCASVVKHESDLFRGIPMGFYTLLRIVLGMLSADNFHGLEKEPVLLALVFGFCVVGIMFLMSLLVAQLSCAYSAVYEDMVGYARLERAQIIVEMMPSVPVKRWDDFVEAMRFHKRLEFNEGDIGLAGGIQVLEPSSSNPTTVDMIKRFGGSTSVEIQWPNEVEGDDEDDRFERMEKMIQRALKMISTTAKASRKGGSDQGKTSGSGSNSDGGQDNSGTE